MSVLNRILPKCRNVVHLRKLSAVPEPARIDKDGLGLKYDMEEFTSTFPGLIQSLSETRPEYFLGENFSFNKYLTEIVDYNLQNSDKKYGLLTVAAYKNFEKPEKLTWDSIKKANTMGWCVEMLKSFYNIMEDLIDDSSFRKGLPCWHKKDNLGVNAINDGLLLFYSIYTVFTRNFQNSHFHTPALDAIDDVSQIMFVARTFQDLLIKDGKPQIDLYTTSNFLLQSKYKNYLHLPLVLALHMANFQSEELHSKVENVATEIGHLHQMQRDFSQWLNPGDISMGKCTWMAVKVLENANSAHRTIMEECYGRPEERAAKMVQNLYQELSLPQIYDHETQMRWKNIQEKIEEIPEDSVKDVLNKLLDNVYNGSEF